MKGIATAIFLAASIVQASEPIRRPWGIETRVPWTASHVQGTPDAPDHYRTAPAFPHIRFDEPLAVCPVPGTNRLAIAEHNGKIYTIENDPHTRDKRLLVDVGRTVFGLAFHPRYGTNGQVFVTSVLDTVKVIPNVSRVSRFTVKDPQLCRSDISSEQVVIEWASGVHNGGCIRFGTDDYLYIGTGDGSGIADELKTGQDIGDLLGSILRIDVDAPGKPYAIPPDNPFINTPGARPEVYTLGHRQPWKFNFDPESGNLWVGEVGQDLWEAIYLVGKGSNCGWSVREGSHPFRPERKHGPGSFATPIVEHPHSDFRCIIGGCVYYGSRLRKELGGNYIYGDFDTGKIWTLQWDGTKVTENYELADSQLRIVDFAADQGGELLILDYIGGQLHQLVIADHKPQVSQFPRKLSETGLFTSTKDLMPAPGLIPYSVNAPLWSDGAEKERFIALPAMSTIDFEGVTYPRPGPGAPPGWQFPVGTVLVKTFSLGTRRVETRLLHHMQLPGNDNDYGNQIWHGYSYKWNDAQTDAELVDAHGLDQRYETDRGKQTWHFPSRSECASCHTMAAKYVLGINTLQMNKDHDYGGVVANQLATLEHLEVFSKPLPRAPLNMPMLTDYRDESQPLESRARAYLHANCAHCHQKYGGGNADFQLLATLPLSQTGTIDVRGGQGNFDLVDPRYIVPGEPERSLIWYRMTLRGLGRMPHIASKVVDEQGVKLVGDWIREMNPRPAVAPAGTSMIANVWVVAAILAISEAVALVFLSLGGGR
jgi:uncharacterized repeat protein (TIGR03806 family)